MAQKGVATNYKYDWPALEKQYIEQQEFMAVKPWWEQVIKAPYTAHITRKTKGWTEKRNQFIAKATEAAQKATTKQIAKNFTASIEDAIKLENRLFYALAKKLENNEILQNLTLKEISVMQDILYKFMGKPTLITQNTNVNVKSVYVILQQLQATGALKDPFAVIDVKSKKNERPTSRPASN